MSAVFNQTCFDKIDFLPKYTKGSVEYTDCRGGKTPPNQCPTYNTKQSDGEVLVMLELWGMRNTLSLPLLLGPRSTLAQYGNTW